MYVSLREIKQLLSSNNRKFVIKGDNKVLSKVLYCSRMCVINTTPTTGSVLKLIFQLATARVQLTTSFNILPHIAISLLNYAKNSFFVASVTKIMFQVLVDVDVCPLTVRLGGLMTGQIMTISCRRAERVPKEYHNMGARSGSTSLFLLSSIRACSLVSGLLSSNIHEYTYRCTVIMVTV